MVLVQSNFVELQSQLTQALLQRNAVRTSVDRVDCHNATLHTLVLLSFERGFSDLSETQRRVEFARTTLKHLRRAHSPIYAQSTG